MKRVTLYTRPGCHLCEAVEQVIRGVQGRLPFEVELRNIEQDPGDYERYRYEIPVVMVDGRELARYRLDEGTLMRALSR